MRKVFSETSEKLVWNNLPKNIYRSSRITTWIENVRKNGQEKRDLHKAPIWALIHVDTQDSKVYRVQK